MTSTVDAATDTDELREFFDRQQHTEQYSSLKAMTSELDRVAARTLNDEVAGAVLCVGGIWDFFEWHERVESLTVLDLSSEMLEAYCPQGATGVVGDLYTHDFAPNSFDTVVFPLMLHHTPVGNWRSCEARVEEALRRARRWLKPSGRVVILDYCPHPLWQPVQRAMLPITRRFLGALGQPLVVMYQRSFYERTLSNLFGRVTTERVNAPQFDVRRWYPVFMSIRWLRVPLVVYPKLHVIIATQGHAR